MDMIAEGILEDARALFARLDAVPEDERVDLINEMRLALREHSPMKAEPVDCVLWVKADDLQGNAYNPNIVAPPEMRLLIRSIEKDGYCVEASTPVLCADFAWRPARSLVPGDRLIAFDEKSAGTGMKSRRFRTAEVTFNEVREDDLYRVVTERGEVLTNSGHPWLAQRMQGTANDRLLRWIATKDLHPDDLLVHIAEPWKQDMSWESGWLAGFLDGEGSLAQNQAITHARGYRLSAYQRPSRTANRMIKEITNRVQATVSIHMRTGSNPKWHDMTMVRVDRFKEVIRLLGTVRPERLIEAGGEFWEGVSLGQRDSRAKVISVEPAGRGQIASLATSTRTYIAGGFAMHNTQPIVGWPVDSGYEVVDGFHRHRVGKESPKIRKRLHGRLPVALINGDRTALEDRQAATIRHNRARGLHTVDGMSEIVVDLARRGKGDAWIAAELGMEPDEVLRLRQVAGLAEMFADEEFSEAWEADPWAGKVVAEAAGSDELAAGPGGGPAAAKASKVLCSAHPARACRPLRRRGSGEQEDQERATDQERPERQRLPAADNPRRQQQGARHGEQQQPRDQPAGQLRPARPRQKRPQAAGQLHVPAAWAVPARQHAG